MPPSTFLQQIVTALGKQTADTADLVIDVPFTDLNAASHQALEAVEAAEGATDAFAAGTLVLWARLVLIHEEPGVQQRLLPRLAVVEAWWRL